MGFGKGVLLFDGGLTSKSGWDIFFALKSRFNVEDVGVAFGLSDGLTGVDIDIF